MRKRRPQPVKSADKLKILLKPSNLKGSPSQKINQLNRDINRLEASRDWITSQPVRGGLPYNRRNALRDIDNELKALAAESNAQKTLREKQENFANRIVLPNDSGEYTGNGKFYIQFVNVGLGDCTLITTPKGVKIMVDCGSHSLSDVTSVIPMYTLENCGTAEEIVGNAIKSQTFLNNSSSIDILVLSHPDEDHHNKLKEILETVNGISVEIVYFGGADFFHAFSSSAYVKEIAGATGGALRKVDLQFNSGAGNVKKMINNASITAGSGKSNQIGQEFIDPTTREMVLYYEDGISDFRLSALASNVTGYWDGTKFVKDDSKLKGATEMKLNGTDANKRSLVVMVRCFGQNILICGDATVVTEGFMLRFFKSSLQTAQTLRIGHHGSPTSSCRAFVNGLTTMNLAVASTGGETTVVHHLPKKPILDLYEAKVGDDAKRPHDIWAFGKDTDSKAVKYFSGITRKLFATGSNDTVPLRFTKPT